MSSLVAGHVTYLSSPRAEPFRERSIGLCLVGHHPVLSRGDYFHDPGHNANRYVPVPALFRTRLSAACDSYLLMNLLLIEFRGRKSLSPDACTAPFRHMHHFLQGDLAGITPGRLQQDTVGDGKFHYLLRGEPAQKAKGQS